MKSKEQSPGAKPLPTAEQKHLAKKLKALSFEASLLAIAEARKSGVEPNVVTITTIINKPGVDEKRGMELVKEFKTMGVEPDVVTVTILYWKTSRNRKNGKISKKLLGEIDLLTLEIKKADFLMKLARATAHLAGGHAADAARMLRELIEGQNKKEKPLQWQEREMQMTATLVFAFLPEQHLLRQALSQALAVHQKFDILDRAYTDAKKFDDVLACWMNEMIASQHEKYGGGTVFDDVHRYTPVNTQAVHGMT